MPSFTVNRRSALDMYGDECKVGKNPNMAPVVENEYVALTRGRAMVIPVREYADFVTGSVYPAVLADAAYRVDAVCAGVGYSHRDAGDHGRRRGADGQPPERYGTPSGTTDSAD